MKEEKREFLKNIKNIEIELTNNRKEMKCAVDARSKMITQNLLNVVKTASIMANRDKIIENL